MREKILSVSYRLWLVGKIRLRPPQSVAEVWGSLADDDVSDDKIFQRAREKKKLRLFFVHRNSDESSSDNVEMFSSWLLLQPPTVSCVPRARPL